MAAQNLTLAPELVVVTIAHKFSQTNSASAIHCKEIALDLEYTDLRFLFMRCTLSPIVHFLTSSGTLFS